MMANLETMPSCPILQVDFVGQLSAARGVPLAFNHALNGIDTDDIALGLISLDSLPGLMK